MLKYKEMAHGLLALLLPTLLIGLLAYVRVGGIEKIEALFLNAHIQNAQLSGVNTVRVDREFEALLAVFLFLVVWLATVKLRKMSSPFVVLALIVACLYGARYLFVHHNIWIFSVLPVASIVLAYLCGMVYRFVRVQMELYMQSLSVNSLLGLGEKFSDEGAFSDFEGFIDVLSAEISRDTRIKIIKPLMTADAPEFKTFAHKDNNSGLMIVYNSGKPPLIHQILLALPNTDEGDDIQKYMLLGMDRKIHMSVVRSVATVVVTAYVYFNASRDAQRLSEMFYDLIQCMIAAVDAKDPVTSGHSQRVADVSEQIAKWMKLPKKQVEQLRFAGMIHDIGKIGIPDHILGKPAPLSEAEFAIMKEHPYKGSVIMQHVDLDQDILDGVLYHHERLDGGGYPFGKTEAELSLTAKIIKVADVYDALIHERQYKKGWPIERVLDLLYEGRGVEFDRDIVDLFIEKMKPPGFVPSVAPQEETRLSRFSIDEYERLCSDIVNVWKRVKAETDAPPMGTYEGKIDFACTHDFFGVSWYSRFSDMDFLGKRPLILHAKGDVTLFALRHDHETVAYSLYYFLRGFLYAGAMICKEDTYPLMEAEFDSPRHRAPHMAIFEGERMNIRYDREIEGVGCGIFYFMKTILEG